LTGNITELILIELMIRKHTLVALDEKYPKREYVRRSAPPSARYNCLRFAEWFVNRYSLNLNLKLLWFFAEAAPRISLVLQRHLRFQM